MHRFLLAFICTPESHIADFHFIRNPAKRRTATYNFKKNSTIQIRLAIVLFKALLRKLCDLGTKKAVLTGVGFSPDELGVMAYDPETGECLPLYLTLRDGRSDALRVSAVMAGGSVYALVHTEAIGNPPYALSLYRIPYRQIPLDENFEIRKEDYGSR